MIGYPPEADVRFPSPCICIRCQVDKGLHRVMPCCPECGNKRCPKGTWHENACTGSNEPGQPGSDYVRAPGVVDVRADRRVT